MTPTPLFAEVGKYPGREGATEGGDMTPTAFWCELQKPGRGGALVGTALFGHL